MKVKEKIAKLIDVKSIVTIMLASTFVYLAVTGAISGEQFLTIFAVVISFYYGTQAVKKDNNK